MVRIVTDSSVLYTEEEAKEAGFDAVPLCIHIGDMEGRDLQVDMQDFYRRIESGEIPMSSQPPVGEVAEIYERYPEDDIINITIADGLSGTYQGACCAKDMAKHPDRIAVFNSRTLCGPQRYMAETAQQMKEEGKETSEILRWLETAAGKTESFLIPQDFSFLKRGGRLTPMAAPLGSVLKLKPVMKLTEDGARLDKFCVKRTLLSAVDSIITYMKKAGVGPDHILYISHAAAPKDAAQIQMRMEQTFAGLEVHVLELSPVFVAQGGPRCVAIQYIERLK